jgi:PAS domain S-box-containing protein
LLPDTQGIYSNREFNPMEKFTLISFLCSIAYLYMGVYTIRLEPDSKLNRIFLVLCAISAWWSLTYSYIFMAERIETVWFWYRLSSIGWCNFPGLTLHFSLILAGLEGRVRRLILYPALYLPGLVATLVVYSPVPLVVQDFVRIGGVWYELSNQGVLGYLFPVFYSVYCLAAAAIPLVWMRSGVLSREKKVGLIFSIGIMISLAAGAMVNNIFPLLGVRMLPAVGYYFGLIWIAGMTFAIVRYKFMSISAALAAEAILGRIKDTIILADPAGRILRVNRETQKLLGYGEVDLKGSHVSTLSDNPGRMAELFAAMKNSPRPTADEEVLFRTRSGDTIPLAVNGSSVRDRAGDALGVVIAGFDLRPRKRLESLNEALQASNSDLEKAQQAANRDMRMAINVQSDLFPATAPDTAEWDTAFYFQPATGISGDMYDFYMEGDRLVGASLFDVSGHGISSGLLSILAKSVIARNFQRYGQEKLTGIVERINNDLVEDIGGVDHYLTGILLRFRDDIVEYINAGHPDLLYRKASTGRVMPVKPKDRESKSFFLGVRDIDMEFECLRFKAFPGDLILLYSDALIEVPGTGDGILGVTGVSGLLQGAPSGTARDIIDHILKSVLPAGEKTRLPDDLTIIALQRK